MKKIFFSTCFLITNALAIDGCMDRWETSPVSMKMGYVEWKANDDVMNRWKEHCAHDYSTIAMPTHERRIFTVANDFFVADTVSDETFDNTLKDNANHHQKLFEHIKDPKFSSSLNIEEVGIIQFVKNDPNLINSYKEKMKVTDISMLKPTTYEKFPYLYKEWEKEVGCNTADLDEIIFKTTYHQYFLAASNVGDCIALIMFDPLTQKACLAHLSKIFLKKDFEDFLKRMRGYFKDNNPQITLVSTYYSNHLVELKNMLDNQNMKVTGMYVPDMCAERQIIKNKKGEFFMEQYTFSVDQGNLDKKYLELLTNEEFKPGPRCKVVLNTQNGHIFVSTNVNIFLTNFS